MRRGVLRPPVPAAPAAARPNAAAQPRALRLIKREEVAKHASETDLWLIIKNKAIDRMCVYDLTEYVEDHPGGEAILTNAGGDATEGFHGPQHPASVHDLVREYHIGYLDEGYVERVSLREDEN